MIKPSHDHFSTFYSLQDCSGKSIHCSVNEPITRK